jgi:uroporphyrinogen decarboxylase
MIHGTTTGAGSAALLARAFGTAVFPNHQLTCEAVLARGRSLSMHSDGNVNSIIDGIVKLGFQVVHPGKVSQDEPGGPQGQLQPALRVDGLVAGDHWVWQARLPEGEIERVIGMFHDGGLIFCTTHFVQTTAMEELGAGLRPGV